MKTETRQAILTILGALAGAIVGFMIFSWLARNQGALGYAIPGVMVSLGAGFTRCPARWVAIVCGVIGLLAGLYASWKITLPIGDGSFRYYVTHAYQLPRLAFILILLGGLIAFWIPFRRIPKKSS